MTKTEDRSKRTWIFGSINIPWVTMKLKAAGGIAVFVIVLGGWCTPSCASISFALEKNEKPIIELLEEELQKKDNPILVPSKRAGELAAEIPVDASPYALSLKAIAERRFTDAECFLAEAQKNQYIDQIRIYTAQGDMNFFQAFYGQAVPWYEKALNLQPDDPAILNSTGLALLNAGKYPEAKPHLKRALEISKKTLGTNHPSMATSMNNLAELYRVKGNYKEAKPLYCRALEINEKALSPNHPDTATSLNDLALLYSKKGN